MSDEKPTGGPMLPNLEAVLQEEILQDRETWPRKGRIYPSDLGTALGPDVAGCPAALWAKLKDEPQKELEPGVLLMFKIGDLVHDYIADLLKRALPRHGWEVVAVEKKTAYDDLGGRLDIKVRHTATGTERVIDGKTKRGKAFRYLPEPKPTDEVQVRYYVQAEGAAGGDLLYIDREGQNFVRHFPVSPDGEQVDRCIELIKRLRDMDEEDLPLVGFNVRVRENDKSAHAVYVDYPWQITWCSMKKCRCAEAVGKAPPKKIVARLHDDGTVTAEKEQYEVWLDVVVPKLQEMYPDMEVRRG